MCPHATNTYATNTRTNAQTTPPAPASSASPAPTSTFVPFPLVSALGTRFTCLTSALYSLY